MGLFSMFAITFTLILFANSATIIPVMSPAEAHNEEECRVSCSFAGDFLINSLIYKAAKTGANIYDFTPFISEMDGVINADIAVCNIDGTIDANGDNSGISPYPRFNAPREILDTIRQLGFNIITTANNHAFDKGWQGLVKTRENIISAGMEPLGTFTSSEEFEESYIKEVYGIKVGMFAATALDNYLGVIIGDKVNFAMQQFGQNSFDYPYALCERVDKLKEAGAEAVIVFLHWGKEYQDAPTEHQREIAKHLAESGVDVIVGGHSHCVQPIEWIDGTLVIYSLGNFFADQSLLKRPKTQYGMIVNLDIVKKNNEVKIENAEYVPTHFRKVNGVYRLLVATDSAAISHVENVVGDNIQMNLRR